MSQQTLSFKENGDFKLALQNAYPKKIYSNYNQNALQKKYNQQNNSQQYDVLEPLHQNEQKKKTSFCFDDFMEVKRIGSGKFGKVFSAKEKKSGVKVALKVVYSSLLEKYDFYTQIRKELEIQYRLQSHPNIIKMYAYFYDS